MKKDLIREYLSKIGAKGGKRAAEAMTSEERSVRAKKAVEARETKRRKEISACRLESANFHWMMGSLMALFLASDVILASSTHLSRLSELFVRFPEAILAAAAYFVCRFCKFDKFVTLFGLIVWAILASGSMAIAAEIAGRTAAPLIDDQLARMDAGLHFSTGMVVAWVNGHAAIRCVLVLVYDTLLLTNLAAIALPVFFGRTKDAQRYVLGVIIAAVLTIALFSQLPAVGPWTIYGYTPMPEQAKMGTFLVQLKTGQAMALDFASSSIISFPSFHTVMAVLSSVALWRIRRVRWFAVTLATLICISTITTGWHYLTDVLGGIVVSAIAVACAFWLLRAPERADVRHAVSVAPAEIAA